VCVCFIAKVDFTLNSSSFDAYSQGVGFQRFFYCNHSMTLDFTNKTGNPENLTAQVDFRNFSVQVFAFKNNRTGEFINRE